ncbi:S-methyl-5-thioribose-1-phosphate isomerase [Ammonifex thiophilus]|uniref:Methylthioribose-1-phosphate isomerase n=1 Tax=Ammonifex thiophilus TaxID=444093 RepID=A0A3D8P674_9THEO|nr:S-methyl-5-thioribose-1-phosphate isomerase [Ammonifex thiophilus]RDV83606.1 S-methyl-5-thioribose-1-phosphate isomerase [Ammonifex thiophilus]
MKPLYWEEGALYLLDQTLLPHKVHYLRLTDYREVVTAIKRLSVRGAPAIGVAAAYALVLAAREAASNPQQVFWDKLEEAARDIEGSRPTAVNLQWAVRRQMKVAACHREKGPEAVVAALEREAQAMQEEDVRTNWAIGAYGAALLPFRARVLTHCNAGSLATCGYGTALGVIRAAHAAGKIAMVYADETRPLLQGARLTTWELLQEGIPVTLITDSTAGYLMARGEIDAVIVGADRIAANGDVANKIGTYSLAVLARHHRIPFYVAAPFSTVDLETATGEAIPIEERGEEEVTHCGAVRIAPEGVKARNFAFDVTPAELITAIITERGVVYPPLGENLRLFAQHQRKEEGD